MTAYDRDMDSHQTTYRILIGALIFAILVLGAVGLVTGIQHANLVKMQREQDRRIQTWEIDGETWAVDDAVWPCTVDELLTAVANNSAWECDAYLAIDK